MTISELASAVRDAGLSVQALINGQDGMLPDGTAPSDVSDLLSAVCWLVAMVEEEGGIKLDGRLRAVRLNQKVRGWCDAADAARRLTDATVTYQKVWDDNQTGRDCWVYEVRVNGEFADSYKTLSEVKRAYPTADRRRGEDAPLRIDTSSTGGWKDGGDWKANSGRMGQ